MTIFLLAVAVPQVSPLIVVRPTLSLEIWPFLKLAELVGFGARVLDAM